jgi:hypothetical protein
VYYRVYLILVLYRHSNACLFQNAVKPSPTSHSANHPPTEQLNYYFDLQLRLTLKLKIKQDLLKSYEGNQNYLASMEQNSLSKSEEA